MCWPCSLSIHRNCKLCLENLLIVQLGKGVDGLSLSTLVVWVVKPRFCEGCGGALIVQAIVEWDTILIGLSVGMDSHHGTYAVCINLHVVLCGYRC